MFNFGYSTETPNLNQRLEFMNASQSSELGTSPTGNQTVLGLSKMTKKPKSKSDNSEPIACALCGKLAKNRNSLKTHRSIYHRADKTTKQEKVKSQPQSDTSKPGGIVFKTEAQS